MQTADGALQLVLPNQLTARMVVIKILDMAATSKRARKRHVQQQLFRRGGKRRGAGDRKSVV